MEENLRQGNTIDEKKRGAQSHVAEKQEESAQKVKGVPRLKPQATRVLSDSPER